MRLDPNEVDRCTELVVRVAGDEEAIQRRKAAATAEKIEAGEPATGLARYASCWNAALYGIRSLVGSISRPTRVAWTFPTTRSF